MTASRCARTLSPLEVLRAAPLPGAPEPDEVADLPGQHPLLLGGQPELRDALITACQPATGSRCNASTSRAPRVGSTEPSPSISRSTVVEVGTESRILQVKAPGMS